MASPGSVVIQFLVDAKKAASDAANLAKGLGKVDDEASDLDATLDGLDRELDSIAAASAELSRDMGKAGVGFNSVGDDAEDAARRVRIAAREMADGVRDGGQKIDTETGHIRQNMADTGKEAGSEFIGNMAEGIGSGSGSVTDVVSGTLGGLTNLAATLGGPVGVAAGVAAAGVGLVFGAVQREAERAKEQALELKDALRDLGETSSAAAKQAIWDTWITQLDTADGLLDEVTDAMRVAGITGAQMQDAITGDPAAQQAVVDKLKNVGTTIADNVRKGKPLTEGQRTYLANQGRIHEELKRMGINLGGIADDHRDIEFLTGKNKKASETWADEQRRVYNETHKIRNELDAAAKDRTSNLTVKVKFVDKNGNPSNLTNAEGETRMAPAAMTTAVAPVAALPPMTVNVQLDQWGSARVVKRAGEVYDRRQGRRPGAPLARAW